jgi:hypothetical protein
MKTSEEALNKILKKLNFTYAEDIPSAEELKKNGLSDNMFEKAIIAIESGIEALEILHQ